MPVKDLTFDQLQLLKVINNQTNNKYNLFESLQLDGGLIYRDKIPNTD